MVVLFGPQHAPAEPGLSRTNIRFTVPSMPKVTEEHRAARREQIISAARKCVLRKGFHQASMADVIAESGLSAGAVYRYFKGKEQILESIADQSIGRVEDMLLELLADGAAPHPADVIETMLEWIVEHADDEEGDFTVIAVQAWGEAVRGGKVLDIVMPKIRQIRELWIEIARRWQAAGHLPADADPQHVGQALMGLFPGFIVQRLLVGDVTPRSYANGLRALLAAR
ncbi:MAG: TetR family transcriptional regulator [Propionibacteriales bacterium]|nr:TetR family transcriptional regulator [Propionibacteriales bacterium]